MDDTSESKYLLYPKLREGNTSRYINKNQSLSSASSIIYTTTRRKKQPADLFYVYTQSLQMAFQRNHNLESWQIELAP